MFPLFVAITLSACGVLADYFLKKAGLGTSIFNHWLAAGMLVYSLTAFGWLYVLRHLNFAQIGVVYSVTTILLMAAMGALFFNESLRLIEVIGIICAIVSVCLLSRFA